MEFCHVDDDHKNLNDHYHHDHLTEIWNVFTLNVCQNTECSDLGSFGLGSFGFTQFLLLSAGIVP